ncbi:hypothetical protein DSM104299_01372 [Baekduia alba]|uniref:hypothetical protein n=1 Tax=Baekduia alba TaxID=2997333 RepID=UPI00233FDCE6|nr:hypothetical protein [Baekduia alba]WCB92674.1 hypothetical protein DSM104299_01372 [Baekduia alba]
MSLSPGFPHGAPTLAEVLLQRTFAKPPRPFVDGEFLEALERSDDAPPANAPVAKSQPAEDRSPGSSTAATPGRTIDVRV